MKTIIGLLALAVFGRVEITEERPAIPVITLSEPSLIAVLGSPMYVAPPDIVVTVNAWPVNHCTAPRYRATVTEKTIKHLAVPNCGRT